MSSLLRNTYGSLSHENSRREEMRYRKGWSSIQNPQVQIQRLINGHKIVIFTAT